MKYDFDSVKKELKEMSLLEGNLIAFGQTALNYGGGLIGSIIANAVADKFAIVKFKDKIMVIPYEEEKIYYDKTKSFEKANIKKAKVVGGIFSAYRLKIWSSNGQCNRFYITHGKKEAKLMLNELGFNLKEEKKVNKSI